MMILILRRHSGRDRSSGPDCAIATVIEVVHLDSVRRCFHQSGTRSSSDHSVGPASGLDVGSDPDSVLALGPGPGPGS